MTTTERGITKSKHPKRQRAEIVREVVPIEGSKVHGVTFDGTLVWYARDGELVAFDPGQSEVIRRLTVPADAGTAYDGRFLYQLAEDRILVVDPADGRVVRTMPAPGQGRDSGMAYGDGFLWVGEYRGRKIHQIDAKTGELVKTLTSDRFVTGVSCVGDSVWHGCSDDGAPAELRRLAKDGTVEEVIAFEAGVHVSGVESDGRGGFWCGGEGGTLRHVRAKK